MEPPLLRVLILRAGLIAVPFAVWFVWRAWAKRTGREMGASPYPWLFAAGAALLVLSLVGSVVFHPDNRGEVYVPGEATASGAVTQGRFETR